MGQLSSYFKSQNGREQSFTVGRLILAWWPNMVNVACFHPSVIPLKSMSHTKDVWPYAFSFMKFYDSVSLPSVFESCIYSHLICIIAEAISQNELLKRQQWMYLTNYLSSPKHNYLCPRCINVVLTDGFETSRYVEKSW